MEGYEVISSDDHKLGEVVEVKGDNLIVERGLLRKSRHAIPKVFAEPDGSEKVVRLTITEDVVGTSPKLDNGEVDQRAVAEHYGLAAGDPAPETEGYGELLPDDPARSAEEQELRSGMEPAAQQRANLREGDAPLDEPRRF
jgi:hypothetical protein